MRQSLSVVAVLGCLVLPASALGQAPGYEGQLPEGSTSEGTPGGQQRQAGGALPAARPAPPAAADPSAAPPVATEPVSPVAKRKRCKTRGKRRTCRYFVNGRHTRTCVRRRPSARRRCRKV